MFAKQGVDLAFRREGGVWRVFYRALPENHRSAQKGTERRATETHSLDWDLNYLRNVAFHALNSETDKVQVSCGLKSNMWSVMTRGGHYLRHLLLWQGDFLKVFSV